jgi:hypothetical protein
MNKQPNKTQNISKLPVIDFQHLSRVNESYWQHLKWAWGSACIFVVLLALAIVHGILPWLFAGWPDKILVNYLNKFQKRRSKTGQDRMYPENKT